MDADLTTALAAFAADVCGAERVEVRWLGVDPARLGEGHPTWEGDPCRARPTLALWWTTDSGSDRYAVRPELVLWDRGPIAARDHGAGERVEAVVGWVRRDDALAWDSSVPAVARRAIRAGERLTAACVAPAPDLPSGARVALRVQAGALVIRGDGRLLQDARVGEPVRVWVAATDRSVLGRLERVAGSAVDFVVEL